MIRKRSVGRGQLRALWYLVACGFCWLLVRVVFPPPASTAPSTLPAAGLSSEPPASAGGLPRRLHQMHASLSALSPVEAQLAAHCRELNEARGWVYTFWNDSAVDVFVRASYPDVHAWWHDMQPQIKRIDTSRYLLMHAFGGAYLDVDVECITALEAVVPDLPRGAAWVGGYPEPMQVMATGVGHPFWLFMVDRIRQSRDVRSAWTTTGPSGLNDALKAWRARHGDAVLVPFLTANTDPAWLAFLPGGNMSVPWFEVHNLKLDNWTGAVPPDCGIGFFPNQLVDPGACAGTKACPNDSCAPAWPQALYAHHVRDGGVGRRDLDDISVQGRGSLFVHSFCTRPAVYGHLARAHRREPLAAQRGCAHPPVCW